MTRCLLKISDLDFQSGHSVNRKFRIVVVDNGAFSFVDEDFYEDQLNVPIIVSHPPDPEFALSGTQLRESANRGQIRVFAYPRQKSQIESVKVLFENEEIELSNSEKHPALYTTDWKPNRKFMSGLHEMKIFVTLENGEVIRKLHAFSFDGTQNEYPR